MFEQNIYRMVDQENGKEIKQVLDTENNKVIWERAIPIYDTPIVPTRNAPLLEVSIDGVCTQNGTPTPDNPAPIMCNNGTLTMVDDELPVGYKRLAGISFDGNFHYETGEYLTNDDDVTMTLDNLSPNGKNVFGSYNGANGKNFSLYIYGSTSDSYFRFGDQLKRPKYGDTGRRTITFGAGGTSGFADDASVDPDEFTTPANVYIGMLPNSSSAAFTGDIVGSIFVGNRLKWIPCESDGGIIGYYEKYKGNFIAPTGSGMPISLGYDGSHLVLSVVGTPEELSAGGVNLFAPTYYTGDGWYVSTSNQVANSASNGTLVFPCKPNTTYSWWHTGGKGGGRAFELTTGTITSEQEATWAVSNPAYNDAMTIRKYTTSADAKLLCVLFARVDAERVGRTKEEQFADFMLVEGDIEEAFAYQPYIEPQTIFIPDLFAVGNYKDEVEIISGGVKRKVGVKVLNGTETGWALSDSGTTHRFRGVKPSDCYTPASRAPSICTHFKYVSTGSPVGGMFIGASQYWYFIPTDQTMDTVEAWRAYLAEQYAAGTPIIVLYPLTTETTESITPQSLQGYRGKTMIVTAQSQYVSGQNIKVKYLGIDNTLVLDDDTQVETGQG